MHTSTCDEKRSSGEFPRGSNKQRMLWGHTAVRRRGLFLSLVIVKAEGITVVVENASAYDVIIVYDGSKNGGAPRFRVSKP